MADYDASVRVNTKVDNSDLSKLQKDFDKLEAKLDGLYKKGEKLEALGVDKQSKQWRALTYDVAQTEMALEDVKDKIQELNGLNVEKPNQGFEKVAKSSKKLFNTIQSGTKKSNGLFATMGTRLKGIALSLLVFNWITKGFNAMVQAMKEGFQNLARYSDEYNQSMSDLKSSAAQLKNGLAAAFEPVANMLIPYLTRLVEWLNVATDAMGQFLAAMQGKSTYTRAKKQVIDYAKSLDTASKSAKRALASFDQLNVLNKENGNVEQSGGLTGADAFEEAEIDPGTFAALERAKELLEIIKPIAIAVGVALLAWKISSFLTDLGLVVKNFKAAYGIILLVAGVVLTVYEYLNMWKNGVDWEGIIGYISGVSMAVLGLFLLFGPVAAGIGLIIAGIAGLVLAFKDMTENGINAENMVLLLISAVGILVGIFIAFGSTVAIVVGAIMAAVAAIAAMVAWAGNGEEAISTLKSMCGNFADFFKKIFAGDIEGAIESLKAGLKDLANVVIIIFESILNCIIKGLNWLIGKINGIKFDVPDWVPVIGGDTLSPDIPVLKEVSLPRLAEGAVIPGGRPFAAILGDQRAGQTNIETPLATMVDAFKQALAENGGGTGGSYTFIAQLNGDTLFEEIVRQDQMYYNATGKGAYQH